VLFGVVVRRSGGAGHLGLIRSFLRALVSLLLPVVWPVGMGMILVDGRRGHCTTGRSEQLSYASRPHHPTGARFVDAEASRRAAREPRRVVVWTVATRRGAAGSASAGQLSH
jgi:hypothetical protein